MGAVVQLDGSGSHDAGGHEPLDYGWAQTSGTPALGLSKSTVVSPTFSASSLGVFTFSLKVTNTSGVISAPDPVKVVVVASRTYGLALAPDHASNSVPGAVLTYTHILTNTGDGPDTFGLALSSSRGWATMDTTPLSVGAGATATLLVSVTVPADALSGTVDSTVITATSQGDTAAWAVVRDTTTAVDRQWKVYCRR